MSTVELKPGSYVPNWPQRTWRPAFAVQDDMKIVKAEQLKASAPPNGGPAVGWPRGVLGGWECVHQAWVGRIPSSPFQGFFRKATQNLGARFLRRTIEQHGEPTPKTALRTQIWVDL